MNIFAVDPNPVKSARQLHDKHVVKMILESAQMLANACGNTYGNSSCAIFTKRFKTQLFHLELAGLGLTLHLLMEQFINGRRWGWDPLGRVQFSTRGYAHHPCTVWVRKSPDHLHWLAVHARALCQEYTRRYGRHHATERQLIYLYQVLKRNKVFGDWRECWKFARAMDDYIKDDDSISDFEAYRRYLSKHKAFYQEPWTRSVKPDWVVSFGNPLLSV